MIITLKKNIPLVEFKKMIEVLKNHNIEVHKISGEHLDIIGLTGETASFDISYLQAHPYVDKITRLTVPFKLASRQFHPEDTIVDVSGIKFGGNEKVVFIAGPCSVEDLDTTIEIAKDVKNAGALLLRGGAYKPRTSPYSFQGLGKEGIEYLLEAKKETGLPIVSEIVSLDDLELFIKYIDLIQVGARNMQNFELLKALGKTSKPILLKRGLSNTIEEWLMSAEYILAGGNNNVILCERGIRTFEKYTRNTLDLSVVPLIKKISHLPIIIDPSHGTGMWDLVEPMSLAAIAAKSDGIMIEVHSHPERALSDGAQSIKPNKLAKLIEKGQKIAELVGK